MKRGWVYFIWEIEVCIATGNSSSDTKKYQKYQYNMVLGILKNSKNENLNKCTIKENNMVLKMIKNQSVYIYIQIGYIY